MGELPMGTSIDRNAMGVLDRRAGRLGATRTELLRPPLDGHRATRAGEPHPSAPQVRTPPPPVGPVESRPVTAASEAGTVAPGLDAGDAAGPTTAPVRGGTESEDGNSPIETGQ